MDILLRINIDVFRSVDELQIQPETKHFHGIEPDVGFPYLRPPKTYGGFLEWGYPKWMVYKPKSW